MRTDSLRSLIGWAWMPLIVASLNAQVFPDGPLAPPEDTSGRVHLAWDPNPKIERVIGYNVYGGTASGGPYHLLGTAFNILTNSYNYATNFTTSFEVVDVGGGFFETNIVGITNVSQHVGTGILAQDTELMVTNLVLEQTIFFVATAYNTVGESLFSNEVNVTIPRKKIPSAPLLISAEPPDMVSVTFTMRDEPILVQKSSDLTNWTEFALLELVEPYPDPVLVSVLLPTAYETMAFLKVEPAPLAPALGQ